MRLELQSLDYWLPLVLDIGRRYSPLGRFALVPEGKVYIAHFAELRAVGLVPWDAVRNLHQQISALLESAEIDAAAARGEEAMVAGE